jgi:hypothetical protein
MMQRMRPRLSKVRVRPPTRPHTPHTTSPACCRADLTTHPPEVVGLQAPLGAIDGPRAQKPKSADRAGDARAACSLGLRPTDGRRRRAAASPSPRAAGSRWPCWARRRAWCSEGAPRRTPPFPAAWPRASTASGSGHGSSDCAPHAAALRGGGSPCQQVGSPLPSPLVLPMLAEQRSGRRRPPSNPPPASPGGFAPVRASRDALRRPTARTDSPWCWRPSVACWQPQVGRELEAARRIARGIVSGVCGGVAAEIGEVGELNWEGLWRVVRSRRARAAVRGRVGVDPSRKRLDGALTPLR